ncbi:MAG: high frequency lysogenization protein HflD [Gammaproteobacteria bacterium]|nr:high frequency lysogenization protein HflD [Gammaproteobacteria bacterium]MDP2141206.1 high frequency lysogenization protein HflD [Gammaproteobacteria bacterium]MDP2349120.1 high frequency lysogenization protein HflD [Gammaproteobacteria bacterium]
MNNTSDKFSPWEYRNIALAVVAQCAQLVHSLATTGYADARQINACIAPLMVLDPGNTAEIYPEVSQFASGLNALQQSLSSEGVKEFGEAIKYVLGMTVLQQQLMRMTSMQALIRRRLQHMTPALLETQPQSLLPENSPETGYDFAALAALYQDTISKLTYRIHVKGNAEYLQDPRVANKIRALLLAGIRSALLWHQLGGRRWHLFFYKKQIRDCVIHVRRNLLTIH